MMCMNNARFISQMLEYHRFTPIILQRYKNLKIPLVKENTTLILYTLHLFTLITSNMLQKYRDYKIRFEGSNQFILFRQESEADRAEVAALHAALCETVPLEKLYERRVWRDKGLAALGKLKRDLAKSAKDE